MACSGCGQGRGWVPPPTTSDGRLRENGVYQLLTYPDCTEPYIGENHDDWVYVIGFRTEHERLFRRSQKSAMVTYFNGFHGSVDLWYDAANRFCDAAMQDLFGT